MHLHDKAVARPKRQSGGGRPIAVALLAADLRRENVFIRVELSGTERSRRSPACMGQLLYLSLSVVGGTRLNDSRHCGVCLDGRTDGAARHGLEQPWPLGRGQRDTILPHIHLLPILPPLAQRLMSGFLEALLYPLQMSWLGTVNRSLFLRMHHVHSSFFLFPFFLG